METKARRYLPALVIAVTLGIGILIGTLLSHGVRAARPAMFASGAEPLPAPSPVELSNSFAQVVRKIEPAVVNINTVSTVRIPRGHGGADQSPLDDFFGRFFRFGDPNAPSEGFRQRSLGSGVILDSKGYILTNYHVITQSFQDRPVDRINVFLHGDEDTRYQANVIGADKWTDLAVIKIEAAKPLPYAPLGDSDSLRVGDWVLAIGSPFGLEATVTAGIISAKGRTIEQGVEGQFKRFLQTDAAINPGNSGGPLVNLAGQVIGINTAIATNGGSNDGVGFAIPSATVRQIYNEIISKGKVRRGAIGVTFEPQQPAALLRGFGTDHGVVIDSVEPGSPADHAGLKLGDVILAIDGQAIRTPDQLVDIVANSEIAAKLRVDYLRNGKHGSAIVEVADRSKIIAENNPPQQPGEENGPEGETAGVLGATVQGLAPDQSKQLMNALHLSGPQGVLVGTVDPDGVAADLSLERGDVILAINHQEIRSVDDFRRIQKTLKSGEDILLLIARRSGGTFTTLFLADRLP